MTCEEGLVQQGHGNHTVELQPLELACAGHTRGDHAYCHGCDQVEEDGESQSDEHHHEVLPLNAMDAGQEAPVDDVPADPHQYSGEDRVRDGLDVLSQTQNEGQQYRGPNRPGDLRAPAGPYVHDRAQGGPRARQPPDEPGSYVADALANQLPVWFVARARHGVCDEGGQQAVDGAEQRNDERRLDGMHQCVDGQLRQSHVRQARRHVVDDRSVGQKPDAQQCPDDQCAQCGGEELAELPRPNDANDKGDEGDGECAEVDVGYRARQGAN